VSVGGLPMVKPLSSNLAGTSGQQLQLRSRCHRVYSSEPSGGAFSARPETLLWRVSARLVRGLPVAIEFRRLLPGITHNEKAGLRPLIKTPRSMR